MILVCHAIVLLPVQGDLQLRAALNDGFATLEAALAAFALLFTARQTHRDTQHGQSLRRAWAILGVALSLAMIGVAIGLAYALFAGRAPSPSPADAVFLSFYLLFILGILAFHRRPVPRQDRLPILLDMGVMMTGSLMIYFALVLEPLFLAGSSQIFAVLTALAYPLVHLVPLWSAVLLLLRQPSSDSAGQTRAAVPSTISILLLVLGTAAIAIGDALVNYQMLDGNYVSGSLYDLTYSAGLLLFGLAGIAEASSPASIASAVSRHVADPMRADAPWRLLTPLIWISLAVAALIWSIVHSNTSDNHAQLAGMVLGMTLLFALVLARQILSSRDNIALARQLQRELEARSRASAELEKAKQELEAKIDERTAALSQANDNLLHEISERKQIEGSLQSQRAFLRQVIDTDPNFIFVKDRQGRYSLVNLSLAYACGMTVEAMIGKTDADFISTPEEVRRFRADDLDVLNTLREKFIAEETFSDDLGNTRWLQTVKRLIIGLDGSSEEVLGVSTDITARRHAEASLRLSENRYRMLFEEARDAIFIADSETGMILDANRAGERLLGLFRENIIGLQQVHLHPPEMEDEYRRIFRQHVQSGGVVSAEVVNSTGKRVPVEINASMIEMPDGREVISGFYRDVSERAQNQAALQRAHIDLSRAYEATLEGWIRALDIRDTETEGHSRRVVELTVRLAQRLGVAEDQIEHVRRGALLHDIGKLVIPDAILLKPGPLTDAEWETMRLHPAYAYDILWPIDYLRPALDIPYFHHEKWDGTGYPRGCKGEQIPLAARLFAVVDVWDAVRYDRPYRKAWSAEQAIDHICAQSGKQFDPVVVDEFVKLVRSSDNASQENRIS